MLLSAGSKTISIFIATVIPTRPNTILIITSQVTSQWESSTFGSTRLSPTTFTLIKVLLELAMTLKTAIHMNQTAMKVRMMMISTKMNIRN